MEPQAEGGTSPRRASKAPRTSGRAMVAICMVATVDNSVKTEDQRIDKTIVNRVHRDEPFVNSTELQCACCEAVDAVRRREHFKAEKTARVAAEGYAKAILHGKSPKERITHKEVWSVLALWKHTRLPVRKGAASAPYVPTDTFGWYPAHGDRLGFVFGKTVEFAHVCLLLNRFLEQQLAEAGDSTAYPCTVLTINLDSLCGRPTSSFYAGPAFHTACGPFKGGRMRVRSLRYSAESRGDEEAMPHKDLRLHQKVQYYDTSYAHEILPFDGHRTCVAWHTPQRWGYTRRQHHLQLVVGLRVRGGGACRGRDRQGGNSGTGTSVWWWQCCACSP